jgi:hypothetical protein
LSVTCILDGFFYALTEPLCFKEDAMSSGPPSRVPYTKPWLSVADQLKKMESRGLLVTDRADAEISSGTSTTTDSPATAWLLKTHAMSSRLA